MQRNLFSNHEPAPPLATGLFAEVVFDRPLDHAYTYVVPQELRQTVAVGKRVQAPFGKGDRPTVGYCVGVSETAPDRPMKELRRVLDAECDAHRPLVHLVLRRRAPLRVAAKRY